MGSRLAKPPPPGRPVAPPRGRNSQIPRPFPVITPQSYVPGGVGGGGFYPGLLPPTGANNFPVLNQNSYLPPGGTIEPPIMNFSGAPGMFPPPTPFPPMFQPTMPPPVPLPPPMPYPNQGLMSMAGPPPPYYDPGFRSYSRRRPARICRKRRSRRCRPVIQIIESSSCSSLSSYATISSCSRHRHRSRSHSRRQCSATPQQQQPIILLPIQCQQPPQAVAAPGQNQIQQQPQQILLPPIHIQQQGQLQQPLALPPMQVQQQPLALPFNSSSFLPNTSSSPMIIGGGGQSMIQPSISMPQISNIGQPQQFQGGNVQYVQAMPQSSSPMQYTQAMPQSSSPLQYVSGEPRSTIIPQRVLVNSTNKKQSARIKPVARSTSARDLPQIDLKYGRRPFDWYANEKKNNIINENVQIGQRGSTTVG